ncbi:MAG: SDR family oxidoreductase [Bacteroidota bacterium]
MKEQKIALITGGSRGLGRDMVLRLAAKGIDSVFTYHSNESAAKEVIEEVEKMGQKVKAFQLDTSQIQGFEAFFEQVSAYLKETYDTPNFDFLINNAGTGIYRPFAETTEAQFDEMVNIHFKGVYFLTQKALPHLNDGGRIINISTGLARFSLPNSSAYAASKGAVEVLSRHLAKELGNRKIAVNVVAPGAIGTDFGGGADKNNAKKREIVGNNTALGRMGEPEDIGGIVAFLCSEDAYWINGQRIEAAGGFML